MCDYAVRALKGNPMAKKSSTENIRTIRPIVASGKTKLAGIETDSVELDKSFTDDLDIDSLSMMTIVVNAEEKFSVRIPDDEVKNLKTVRDAVTFIHTAQG